MNTDNLHEKFVEYGRNAKEWKRKCLLLLPDIEKYKIWREKGFESIYDYAIKLAGIGRWQVDDTLRICKKIADKPALMQVAIKKGLEAIRPIATIAKKEDANYWAKQAESMSQSELKTFVRDIRIQEYKLADRVDRNDVRLKTLSINIRPEIAAKLEGMCKKLCDNDWNLLFEKFLGLYSDDLEREKPRKVKVEKNKDGKISHHIPAKTRKFVHKRSGGKCEFPACTKDYDDLHHINRFSSDHVHDPDQIVALCKSHHKLTHRGLVAHENRSPNVWTIRKEPDLTDLGRFIDEQVQFYRRR